MANFAVATNFGTTGSRLTTGGDSTTGWSGGGAEPDFYYQGATSYSVLVKTTEAGVAYTDGSTRNFSTNRLVAHVKVIQTNKDAIDGDGLQVWVGNDATHAYSWFVYSATTYPTLGGWCIIAIDPQVSTGPVARNTEGTAPSMTTIDYFAFRSDCNATAKSQNFSADAIEIIENGKGLIGTGADTAGTFTSFLTFDEGTIGNRYGIVQSRGGIYYVTGVLRSVTPTPFSSPTPTASSCSPIAVVTTGFCGLDIDITHASSSISITNCFLSGRGTLYGSDDRRPDYEVTGTGGTVTLNGTTFNVYRLVTLNSKVTALGCIFIAGGSAIIAAGADMRGSTVSGVYGRGGYVLAAWDVATDPDGKFDEMAFVRGTNAHHAIELGASSLTTVTLRGVTFTGFNATDAAERLGAPARGSGVGQGVDDLRGRLHRHGPSRRPARATRSPSSSTHAPPTSRSATRRARSSPMQRRSRWFVRPTRPRCSTPRM